MFHINISIIKYINELMFMSGGELDVGHVTAEAAAKPMTTVQDHVSTIVSPKAQDLVSKMY